MGKVFLLSVYIVYHVKVVINLMLGGKNYENSKSRAGFLSWISPKGLTLRK